jgi:hypothetical protein
MATVAFGEGRQPRYPRNGVTTPAIFEIAFNYEVASQIPPTPFAKGE